MLAWKSYHKIPPVSINNSVQVVYSTYRSYVVLQWLISICSCRWCIWANNLLHCFFIINYSCDFTWQIISGDDDLPKRDDIGERRRKHELRVLAGAGVESGDEVGDGPGTLGSDEDKNMECGESESEDDLYKQVKQQRASKLAAKSKMYANFFSCLSFLMQSSPSTKLCIFIKRISSFLYQPKYFS